MQNGKCEIVLAFCVATTALPSTACFQERTLCRACFSTLGFCFSSTAFWLLLCTAQTCAGPERGHQCYLYWGWQQQHSKKYCARAGWVLKKGWQWQRRSQAGRLPSNPVKTERNGLTWLQSHLTSPKTTTKKMVNVKKNGGKKMGKPLAKAGMPGGKRKKTSGKNGPRKKLA